RDRARPGRLGRADLRRGAGQDGRVVMQTPPREAEPRPGIATAPDRAAADTTAAGTTATGTAAGRNRVLVMALSGVAFGMGLLSFAAVPLYDMFCRVTGWGGTPQIASDMAAPEGVIDR